MDATIDTSMAKAKRAARVLREQVPQLSQSQALEVVARQLGHRDWNTASARLIPSATTPPDDAAGLGVPVPVLRSLDETRAREFYVGYLHFTVEWEHRFEPGLPLYLRLRRGECVLDLSEHHGDGTPGSTVWVPVADVRALHRELRATGYARMNPGLDDDGPGGPTVEVVDPFANTLRFCQVDRR